MEAKQAKLLPVVPACIPQELRALPQWVVWALESPSPDRKSVTKIPYHPDGHFKARSNDAATWGTFERAWATYRANPARWAGVGFMFAAENGLVGIDLDQCRGEDGTIAPWAREIIDRLKTYAEVSPSATGVKLWARGVRPGDRGRKRPYQTGAVEMYSSGRFFAVTGHRLEPGADTINEAQEAIDWLWKLALERNQESSRPSLPSVQQKGGRRIIRGEDALILRRARQYVAKMPPAISGQGGHDQTFAAACALVLGFNLTPAAALGILREYNARCEPKWSERELWHKLDSADKQTGERGYLLNAERARKPAVGGGGAARRRGEEAKRRPGDAAGENAGGSPFVLAKDLDPRATVEALVKSITRDGVPAIRFWRGTFWRWAAGRYREMLASETRVRMVTHLNKAAHKLTREVVNNHLMQFEAQTALDADAEPPSWIGVSSDWSAREVLACRNSLVYLPGYLDGAAEFKRAATPAFFNTSALDFDFDPDAGNPAEWRKFLEGVWQGDADSVDVLREWFGYCLTPDTSQHKILLLVGPPRCGKGTIARVLRRLVGIGNTAGPVLSDFEQHFGLEPLIGKTLAVVSDARLGGGAAAIAERLLSISGEDELTIGRKFLPAVTCTLPTRLVILSNELPRITDASGALASRMLILRFTRSWLGSEDHTLTGRLLQELPGILLWSILGWRRLRERGHFIEPGSSADVREQLADLTSAIGVFLRERCELGRDCSVPRADLYAAYRLWCAAAGRDRIEDAAGFGRSLRAAVPCLGTSQPRVNGAPTRLYTGVCLKAENF